MPFELSCHNYNCKEANSPSKPSYIYSPLYWCIYFAIFTSSFDIFLVINIGFNFRASQLVLLPILLYVLITRLLSSKSLIPLGFDALLLWSFFIFLFIPNTSFPTRSIGYMFWLAQNILTIFCLVNTFKSEQRLLTLVRCYIYSFAFVASFGLLQFILPLLGLDAPLVQQWWIPGRLARINGFSYEPSYFATYILIGWVFLASLSKYRLYLIKNKHQSIIYVLLSIVMILSSSRMGWLVMAIWYLDRPVKFISGVFRARLSFAIMKQLLGSCFICLLVGWLVIYVVGFDTISFLFAGMGIAGESSHSADTRTREFMDTFTIFLKSPLFGYSLGGISSAIGDLRGVDVSDVEMAKMNEGMSVFLEVLAASGIIGVLFFVLYVFKLFWYPLRFLKGFYHPLYSPLLKSLLLSLFFEFIILQLNQNILRSYLWMHIAILSATYSIAVSQRRSTTIAI